MAKSRSLHKDQDTGGATSSGPSQGTPDGALDLQGDFGNAFVQELVHRQSGTGSSTGSGGDGPAAMGAATAGPAGEVPHRAQMEAAFGEDFGGVEAYTGRGDALGEIGASAAASGEAIAFAAADPDPTTVAHELTHVVQARRGGSAGGVMGDTGLSDPGSSAELEARRVGAVVGAGGRAPAITASPGAGVQREEATGSQQAAFPPGWDPAEEARKLNEAFDGWGTDERAVLDILYTGRQDMSRAIERAYNARYSPSLSEALHDELSGDDLRRAIRLLGHGEFTLRDRVREGVEGWGTDEEMIFNALERASREELDALAGDAELMAHLRSDLDDVDFQMVQAYLRGQGQLAATLRRAVDGWGTDEEAIWRALERASEEEKQFVLSQPYLLESLRSDLNDADWMRCERSLRGTLDNADRVMIAMEGWGTDEASLMIALGALSAEEFGRLPVDIDSWLSDELSGADYAQAAEILHQKRLSFDPDYREFWLAEQAGALGEDALTDEGASVLTAAEGQQQSAVGRILTACAGGGTDESAIFQALSGMSEAEKRFVRERNPMGVLDRMRDDLSSGDYQRALEILGGGAAGTLAGMREAVEGWGTDDTLLYQNLDRLIQQGGAGELLADQELLQSVLRDISPGQQEVLQEALRAGRFTPLMRLRWATDQAGTDEALVFELTRTYAEQWRSADGGIIEEVDRILQSELDTRDYWQALDNIRGEPRTEEERLARAKEQLERERSGVSAGINDLFSDSGYRADDAWREYQATYNQAYQDGQISEEETRALRRDEEFSQRMTAEYHEAKAALAQWATTIAVAIVGIAATILTAGSAGPFVAALAAQLGGTAAVAAEAMVLAAALKVGLNRAIQGEGYDLTSTQALVDAVSASVEVGMTMVGGQVATRFVGSMGRTSLGNSVSQSVERVFGQAGQRILAAGLEGTIDGTVGGIGEGLVQGLATESTWEGDIGDALANLGESVGTAALLSAAGGFAAGSAFQSLGETFGPMLRGRVPDTAGGGSSTADGVSGAQGEDILGRSSNAELRDTLSVEDASHRALAPRGRPKGSGTEGATYHTGDYVTYEGDPHWGVLGEEDGIVTIVRNGQTPLNAFDIRRVPASELSPGVRPDAPGAAGAASGVEPGTLGPDRSQQLPSDAYNGAPRDLAYHNRSGTQQLHVDPDSDPALREAIDRGMERISRGQSTDEQLAHLVDHVHNDVTYDMNAQQAMYNTPNSLPVGQARLGEMLRDGAVVCREKAIFTHQLLAELGIESRVVTGNVHVNGGSYGHAWVVLADGTVVDGTWGKIYPQGRGYPVDRVIKDQVFAAPRTTLDPAQVDQAVARASSVLDNPRQLRALQQQASGPRALSPAEQLLTNGNTVALPERRGGLLGWLGMKKKARITRVERDMVFVEVDGQEVMYPRGDILEANGISARSSNASARDTSSLEDDSHRAFAEDSGLDAATRSKLSSALEEGTVLRMVEDLGAERVARLSAALKPRAVQRVWEVYQGHHDYLIRLLDDVGLQPRHIDQIPRRMGLAEAMAISQRVDALRGSGQIEGRILEIEQRILSSKGSTQGGHIGELEAMERWVAEGRSVKALAEVEDGGANPDFLVDGDYVEVKTTSKPLTESWLSNKLSHANAKARDQALRELRDALGITLEIQLTGEAARASLEEVEEVVLSQFIESTSSNVTQLKVFADGRQLGGWARMNGGHISRTYP